MSYYILLEAETGKVYVKPYYSFDTMKKAIGCDCSDVVHAALLPEPFRIICDDEGLILGKPLNLFASFYYGMIQNRCIISGDCAILKASGEDLQGLNETELRFMLLNLKQHFGCNVPEVAG